MFFSSIYCIRKYFQHMQNSTSTLKNEIDQIPFEKKINISLFCIFQNSDKEK